jgi:hypothetical protein
MQIRDISKPITARALNESLEKRFGKRVKLESFSLDQLYDARNKLRTALSQIETNESYGAVNVSESYQKNKLFLDVIVAEIAEREAVEVSEATTGTTGTAGTSANKPDPETKKLLNKAERGQKLTPDEQEKIKAVAVDSQEESIEEEFDDMRPDSVPDYDENDLDYEGGMAHKQLSTIEDAADELSEIISANENLPEWVQKKIILSMSYIDTARDYMKSAGKVDDEERGMPTESIVREGAEDQAEIVMAAKNMVDKITSWMEDTAEMQTESMLDLGDSIRDELGEEQSQQFTSTVKPSLESLYTALEDTRSTLVSGVRLVAGEEVADMPGDDMDAEDPEMEPTVDQEDGDIEDIDTPLDTDDEFSASEPAAGGEEEAGREKRESINRSRKFATMLSSKKK